jgi:hypothetical protein
MKNIILLALMLAPFIASAQVVVNGTDINSQPDVEYVQLVGVNKPFSDKVIVSIDYGQDAKMFESQAIKGPDGKPVNFNSMVSALNFMVENGWMYVNSYPIWNGQSNVYHYLLKRKRE